MAFIVKNLPPKRTKENLEHAIFFLTHFVLNSEGCPEGGSKQANDNAPQYTYSKHLVVEPPKETILVN